jgi:hypothetical protein
MGSHIPGQGRQEGQTLPPGAVFVQEAQNSLGVLAFEWRGEQAFATAGRAAQGLQQGGIEKPVVTAGSRQPKRMEIVQQRSHNRGAVTLDGLKG